MRRPLGRAVAAALVAGLLATVATACTSATGDPGAAATGATTADATPISDAAPTADADPTSETEPTDDPTYATEPDEVETEAPAPAEPGDPEEVDGRLVLPPVPLDQAVSPADAGAVTSRTGEGLTIWLDGIAEVDAVDPRPGTIGGPGIQVGVLIRNDGAEAFDLATVVVGVEYGAERVPAEDVITTAARPLTGTVRPGQTLRGVFDFVVPEAERDDVVVSVDLVNELPVTLFAGAVRSR